MRALPEELEIIPDETRLSRVRAGIFPVGALNLKVEPTVTLRRLVAALPVAANRYPEVGRIDVPFG